jgi:hypothetical protein
MHHFSSMCPLFFQSDPPKVAVATLLSALAGRQAQPCHRRMLAVRALPAPGRFLVSVGALSECNEGNYARSHADVWRTFALRTGGVENS